MYEIYFINLWKPPLNKDDKATDELTIHLPDVKWHLFSTPLWEKWRIEIAKKDAEEETMRKVKREQFEKKQEMRRKLHTGEISPEEYDSFLLSISELMM